MNLLAVQNLQELIPVITSIIISLGRMRLVEVLKFIIFFLVLAMAHFLYKWASLMERSDCRVAVFLLCIGAALVLVLGTVVAVLEGREDEREGRRDREQKAWQDARERSQKDWKDESERRQKDWEDESERKQKDWKDESERQQKYWELQYLKKQSASKDLGQAIQKNS